MRPCRRSKFARNTLADHLPAGMTSPVGTNHRPVSPLIVGSAGRGVVSPSRTTSSDVTTGPDVVVVVVLLPPPCCACAAAGTAASAITRNAEDKIRTNTDASLFRLDVEKYGPAISLLAQAPFPMRRNSLPAITSAGFDSGHQSTASTATDLPAFAAGGTRLISGPFVGCAFLVRGASTLARDLALLLRQTSTQSHGALFEFRPQHSSSSTP